MIFANSQKLFGFSRNSGSKILTGIGFYLRNSHSGNDYDLYLEVYDTDNNSSSANPWSKFSGSPIATSSTVTLNKSTSSFTEVKFTFTGNSLSLNTDYYVVVKKAASSPNFTGNQSIKFSYNADRTGGAGNHFGPLNRKIYGRDP